MCNLHNGRQWSPIIKAERIRRMKRHTISLLISLLTMSYLLLVYITNHIAPDTGELLDKTMKYPPLGDFSPNALQIPTLIIFAVSSFLSWIWWPSKKNKGK